MPSKPKPGQAPRVPCKSAECGKPVVFARDPDGKPIVLDPRPPVYLVVTDARGTHCKRMHDAMVSHFATCKRANDFSKSKPAAHTDEGAAGFQPETQSDAPDLPAGVGARSAVAPPPLPAVAPLAGPEFVASLRRWGDEMAKAAELVRGMDPEVADGNAEVAKLLRRAANILGGDQRDADPAAMLVDASVRGEQTKRLACVRCGLVDVEATMRAHVCPKAIRKPELSPQDKADRFEWLFYRGAVHKNYEADTCQRCSRTDQHEHFNVRCKLCDAVGLDVAMLHDHKCNAGDDGMRQHENDAWNADAPNAPEAESW